MVNGNVADDINKASQGQTSLVSIALSFALVKELGMRSGDSSGCYPIPLLDEPDAPLHKTDKPKLISILMKYLDDINSEQCFVITHDNSVFDGHKIQVIMTTNESVNTDRYADAIHV
jgi:DNA repair exonuclease SbcCD ATPase subunit